MPQRYFQELHQAGTVAKRDPARVSMRRYVHYLRSKSLAMALSQYQEFLDDVFSAEGTSRFFKLFLLRFLTDSNSKGEDSLHSRLLISL